MKSIKDIAQNLINVYGTKDPFKISQERNIELIFEDLEDILGYYHYHRRVQLIHINHKLSDTAQRFVCAHELGHAIQHPKENTAYLSKHTLFSTNKLENEANTFAVELLVQDEDVFECLQRGYNLDQISRVFGVPKQFMKFKTF
jgi:Zn-dependent peptidase ImmA (M78 family)